MRFTAGFILAAAFLCGCRHSNSTDGEERERGWLGRSKPVAEEAAGRTAAADANPSSNSPRVTPLREPVGRVAAVHQLGFIVVDFAFSELPALDRRMGVYRNGQKVGEIRISGPARDQNIAADIVRGGAQVGDEIRP